MLSSFYLVWLQPINQINKIMQGVIHVAIKAPPQEFIFIVSGNLKGEIIHLLYFCKLSDTVKHTQITSLIHLQQGCERGFYLNS